MRKILFLLLVISYFNTHAQNDSLKRPVYFSLYYDNDFFAATDRYYTQGTSLNLIHPGFKYSPLFFILPGLKTADTHYGLSLHQDVFTPRSIRYMGGAVYEGERPFTALLYLTHTRYTADVHNKQMLQTAISIGVLGPEAKGEETQKGIHKALNNIEPLGWQNQLSTSPILNYKVRYEKGLLSSRFADLSVVVIPRAGTLYTDMSAGIQSRIGLLNSYYILPGIQSPSARNKKTFSVFFVFNAAARLVGYNATLQGGLLNTAGIYHLPGSALNRIIAGGSAGVILIYRRLSLEFSRHYLSPEFKNALDHNWGRCSFSVLF